MRKKKELDRVEVRIVSNGKDEKFVVTGASRDDVLDAIEVKLAGFLFSGPARPPPPPKRPVVARKPPPPPPPRRRGGGDIVF